MVIAAMNLKETSYIYLQFCLSLILQKSKWTTENEMVGWHHQLDGHAFEQALGVSDGQESLACCSPWGSKDSDMTEQLN